MIAWKPGFQGTGRTGETPEQFRVRTLVDMQQWTRQAIHAERLWRQHLELDAREDECWRMFGIEVRYVMDERIVITKAQGDGADSMWGL